MAEAVEKKFVDKVVDKAAGEVVGSLFTEVKKQIGYMRNSKENVEELKREVEKLKKLKKWFDKRKEQVRKKAKELLPSVQTWVEEAGDLIEKADKFLQEEARDEKMCCNCLPMCVNLWTLYYNGKEAINKVTSLEKHRKAGERLEKYEISTPIGSPERSDLLRREIIDDLETHKSALEEIIDSVNKTQITGIWGIGGVGKTTLATEVAARVKDLFALVVFVTVSQNVDAASIKKQVEIAADLINQGETDAASNKGKVLIIMDDVWTKLNLGELGIPCGTGFPRCKILLTSRERSVLKAMNAQEICVGTLPIEEARSLFKRVVCETDAKLEKVEEEIVKGCGGLPLILQAVGKALKDKKKIKEWENARDSIQKHKTLDIDEDIELEFAHLQLSYDYLKSEDAKSIFLLCSMFPEDFGIPLELLAYYVVGLELFEEPYSLEDARNKVQRAVRILKSSGLLLVGKDESTTKMHDVVREVALLIASKGTFKGKNKFLVEAGKNLTLWEPRPGSLSYTGISLMRNDIRVLPAGYYLHIPRLKIFLVQKNYKLSEISDEFIRAMRAVKVIDFECTAISCLPKSLNRLKKVRMLNLGKNINLCDVSILGELGDLEILILNETGITEIPQEIGKLVKLRLLHAAGCHNLSHIAPGVLSKLRWLEELRIGYYQVEEGENNSLVEIGELSKLKFLNLWVKHICLIPEVDYLKGLERFSIQFGGEGDWSDFHIPGYRTLILDTVNYADHVRKVIEVCNGITLRYIENLDKEIPMMYCTGGFSLKVINIVGCKLLYLVDSSVLDKMLTFHPSENIRFLAEVEEIRLIRSVSLKGIWNCADEYISFYNLVTLNIVSCPMLEKLLSVSVAEGLVNLKELKIDGCISLKEVISDGNGEASTSEIETVVPPKHIVFHRLAKIWLYRMVSLTSFYSGNATIEYPSLVEVEIWDSYNINEWGNRTHDTPKLPFVMINGTKANDSTIVEALAKYKEAEELRVKQRHDQRTEEGPSSVGEE